ncbi:MAG: metallophosphatase [Bacteroidetes bacterium]|mgnify:CR=1 FL=1|nr:metallophosphatase [Bacteroidota bacterium]MBK9412777.1 metallophosphatase [Bacteroidota bacterium]MBL0032486.1 metallophosphatase [Bacteroidota bacterium]MBP6426969.1 metallophosphatase [Bacteroidia bacterium]MBP6658094.1 metallophosphatase [Bacteroidia bacterium]
MADRREFIKGIFGGIALAGLSSLPIDLFAKEDMTRLTILHTNDVHSRIDPFPPNDPKYPNMGGVARRAALIKKIRSTEKNVLLLDAGDIFQGTPYFNLYGGELEFKLMSEMGYDASTLGNHDFDNGIDGLVKQMPNMNFPFLNANYSFNDTLLENKVNEYKIFRRGNLQIGVFGIGIELRGLVDPKLTGNILYNDPLVNANRISTLLKNEEKCDLVICLSHLGYKYNDKKVSDSVLAKESSNIDLIIGGHTHTFLDEPTLIINKDGKEVLIAQVGWAGIKLGRIDYYFDSKKRKKDLMLSTVKISENTIGL